MTKLKCLFLLSVIIAGIGVEINEEGMKKYAIAGVPFIE